MASIAIKFILYFVVGVALYCQVILGSTELRVKSTHEHMLESEIFNPISNVTSEFIKRQIKQIKFYNMTLINDSRMNATLWLAKAAMHLPGGDFVETGMWLGGTSALMIHSLTKFDTCGRQFWGFDSFDGHPPLSEKDTMHHRETQVPGYHYISLNETLAKLTAVGVYPESIVHISKGWFNDTCAASTISSISFLRIDSILYQSTWDVLQAFYDRVMPGGFIYVDDYGAKTGCKAAVVDFRDKNSISEELNVIPDQVGSFSAVWWQKGHQ